MSSISGEEYPKEWKHCTIHLNPETGIMHSDGDHSVRHWIEGKIKRLTAEGRVNARVAAIAHEIMMHWCYEKPNSKITAVIDAEYIAQLENAFDGLLAPVSGSQERELCDHGCYEDENCEECARADSRQRADDLRERIKSYLGNGGLFNPELMAHEKVRDLIMDCRDEIDILRFRLIGQEVVAKYRASAEKGQ